MAGALIPVVQRVTQDSQIDSTGALQLVMRVQFMVGTHGPFFVLIPAGSFTAAYAQTAMQVTADEINKLPTGAA